MKRIMIIHGGAGRIDERLIRDRIEGLRDAIKMGFERLLDSDDPVEAVVEAVAYMEDTGLFNAGAGSIPTSDGDIEMDAAVMDWRGRYGSVGAIPNIRNPVRLAYWLMNNSRHRLLVGDKAKKLAFRLGFTEYNLGQLTGLRRINEYMDRVKRPDSYPRKLLDEAQRIYSGLDTVGALARNSRGEIAGAVSTGGLLFKLGGRVGDSSIIGAGLMVDGLSGAVATGIGETIMDTHLCLRITSMRRYMTLRAACIKAIRYHTRMRGKGTAGVICIDRFGWYGWMYNTEMMSVSYMHEDMDEPFVTHRGEGFYKI